MKLEKKICLTPSALFWAFLFLQILVMLYYGHRKLNLFGDEIWTYNLANNYFEPFIGDASKYYNIWMTGEQWNQKITVYPTYEFSFASVFFNQAHDVHPPLYYMVIHTICSLFPMQFSKWFGILPNILCFIVTQVLLCNFSKKLFRNEWLAVYVCLFWGFSWGTVNNVVYIRMYALLTIFAVLSYILHLTLIQNFNLKKFIMVLFVSFLGIFTQYYFLIYEFFVSAGFCAYLCYKGRFNILIQYILGFIVVLITVIMAFPAVINQILGKVGNQGQAAFVNLATSPFHSRIDSFGHIISKDLFGGHIVWVAYLIVLLVLAKLLGLFCTVSVKSVLGWRKIVIKVSTHTFNKEWEVKFGFPEICAAYALFVSLGYFLVIAKIAPYLESRYLVIIHPLLCVLFIYVLDKLRMLYTKSYKMMGTGVCILLILFCGHTYRANNLFGFDRNYQQIQDVIDTENGNIAQVVVTHSQSWWPAINELLVLRQISSSYMISENNIDSLTLALQDYSKKHSTILVYRGFDCKIKDDEFITKIKSVTEFKNFKKLDTYMGDTYLFEKE